MSATDVVSAASGQIGKPYVWAAPPSFSAKNPSSFDCSGLTGWAYKQGGGGSLPHNAQLQYRLLKHRPVAEAQPGDLVFLGVGRSTAAIHHVMLVSGAGTVIEAADYGIPVRSRAYSATESEMIASAGVFPGSSLPFGEGELGTGKSDSGVLGGITDGTLSGNVGNAGKDILDAATAIPRFLALLSKGDTWVRVAEFTAGGLLLVVGISYVLRSNMK